MREKCPNTELFLVRIWLEYRKIRTRNNSIFGHFPRNDIYHEDHLHLLSIFDFELPEIYFDEKHVIQNQKKMDLNRLGRRCENFNDLD